MAFMGSKPGMTSIAENHMQSYVRVRARWAAPNVPLDDDERERWLANWLYECLSDYERALKQMCDHLQEEWTRALAVQAPPQIIIKTTGGTK